MSHNPKALLDSCEILPKKSLGQNFMHDPKALEKIVASAEPYLAILWSKSALERAL